MRQISLTVMIDLDSRGEYCRSPSRGQRSHAGASSTWSSRLREGTRQDAVEETWRVMQPLLDNPDPVHTYAPDSWGPTEGEDLVAAHGRWHGPWIAQ